MLLEKTLLRLFGWAQQKKETGGKTEVKDWRISKKEQ